MRFFSWPGAKDETPWIPFAWWCPGANDLADLGAAELTARKVMARIAIAILI
jgi:hypothetical protein